MLNRGVTLTPGQTGGPASRGLEGNLAGICGLGSVVRARQADAVEAWNKKILSDAVPNGDVSAA